MLSRILRSCRNFSRDDAGHAAVEYALVLAMILLPILVAASYIFPQVGK